MSVIRAEVVGGNSGGTPNGLIDARIDDRAFLLGEFYLALDLAKSK